MTVEKWPEPDGGSSPNPNPSPPAIEPARPAKNKAMQEVGRWGTDFAKDQARGYAVGKAAQIAARTALGARVLGVTRWIWLAEWGALGVAVVFAALGIIGIIQNDTLLGTLVLILAALAFGVYLLVRKIRRFVERQIARAFAKFQSLLRKGVVRSDDWPEWFRKNRQQV
jgi:hypothetical protein